jgi:multiple sugar transport system substrate-binding protein
LPYYKYISKDLLADLSALMNGAEGINTSQYYGNVLDASKTSGKLYAVPSCFTFSVLSSTQQYSPGGDNATMQEFLAKAAALPSGVFAFARNDPMQILSGYMQDNYCNFVDYGTHTASFNSPAFIDMIKAFKTLFDTKMSDKDVADGKEFEQLMDGTVAYSVQIIRRDMDVAMAKSALGANATFTNVPVAGDSGVYPFVGRDMLAVNAGSKHGDIAWEFVKTMLSADVQTNGNPDGFPVLKTACQSKLDKMAGEQYILDKSGKRAVVKFGDTDIEMKPLNAADTAWLSSRIGKLNKLSAFDDTILKIINEELPPFFSGQKSAEDVAALIQNRVNIVLNE